LGAIEWISDTISALAAGIQQKSQIKIVVVLDVSAQEMEEEAHETS
jgi:hypothetical protein